LLKFKTPDEGREIPAVSGISGAKPRRSFGPHREAHRKCVQQVERFQAHRNTLRRRWRETTWQLYLIAGLGMVDLMNPDPRRPSGGPALAWRFCAVFFGQYFASENLTGGQ
jgi:hypothetical protein